MVPVKVNLGVTKVMLEGSGEGRNRLCKMKHSSQLGSCNNVIFLYNYEEDASQPAHVKGTSKFFTFLVLKSCSAMSAKL